MTILTKPSFIIKKTPLIYEGKGNEESLEDVVQVRPLAPWERSKHSTAHLVCMSLTALLVVIVGFSTGLFLYRNYMKSDPLPLYKGFCSIPIVTKPEPYRVTISVENAGASEPALQVVDTVNRATGTKDRLVSVLREELDIGHSIEKISVVDGGRTVTFVHDFDNNITGISEEERCFVTALSEAALPPAELAGALRAGAQLEVPRVQMSLNAVLPRISALNLLAARLLGCAGKPLYRLQPGHSPRGKRAAGQGRALVHFAGRHVLELLVANRPQLLQHERHLRAP